jgi:hypothetical protein
MTRKCQTADSRKSTHAEKIYSVGGKLRLKTRDRLIQKQTIVRLWQNQSNLPLHGVRFSKLAGVNSPSRVNASNAPWTSNLKHITPVRIFSGSEDPEIFQRWHFKVAPFTFATWYFEGNQ